MFEPLEVTEIRDNGGKTFDRYIVGFACGEDDEYALLIGETGNAPNGVCMHDDKPPSEDDGELVEQADLPEAVQRAIANEFALHARLVTEEFAHTTKEEG